MVPDAMQCAGCGRKIFRYSLRHANWCPNDEVFLCRHCLSVVDGRSPDASVRASRRRFVCPGCAAKPVMDHTLFVLIAIFVVIFGGVFFAVDAGSFLYDSAIQSTPQAPLSQVTVGSTVHVAGTIVAPTGQTVLWAHWVYAGKSCHWNYYGTSFGIRGNNVILPVDATSIKEIYTAPDVTNGTDDMAFHQGDHVELIGTVTGSPTAPTLDAQDVAMNPNDFLPATEGWIALITGFALLSVAAIALYLEALGLERGRKHRDHTQGPNAFQYRLSTAHSPSTAGGFPGQ